MRNASSPSRTVPDRAVRAGAGDARIGSTDQQPTSEPLGGRRTARSDDEGMCENTTADDRTAERSGGLLDLHRQIARLALLSHGGGDGVYDECTLLRTVADTAVRVIDGVDHAAITLLHSRRRRAHHRIDLESVAATTDHAEFFERVQLDHGEGPCITAVAGHDTVVMQDLEQETRWPLLTAAVLGRTPITSALSVCMSTADLELGTLDLFSDTPGAFDTVKRESSTVYATHAAITLDNARRAARFRQALDSRDIIGQAKGMIMERYDVDAVAAFDLLRKLSQDSNIPLVRVAERLVATDHPSTS